MVRSSWYPSARLPKMSRRRLIFAKAGMRTSVILRLWLKLWFVVRGRRFLRYAMFRLRELLFEFGYFLGFDICRKRLAPFGEGLLPFRGGQILAATLGVDIAQVRMDGGIVTLAGERFPQHGFSVGCPIFLEINPAQAIKVAAVIRLFF